MSQNLSEQGTASTPDNSGSNEVSNLLDSRSARRREDDRRTFERENV